MRQKAALDATTFAYSKYGYIWYWAKYTWVVRIIIVSIVDNNPPAIFLIACHRFLICLTLLQNQAAREESWREGPRK